MEAAILALRAPIRRASPQLLERVAYRLARSLLSRSPERRRHLTAAAAEWLGLQLTEPRTENLFADALALEITGQLEAILRRDPRESLRSGHLTVDGLTALQSAQDRGRGVVLLSSHVGHHRLLGSALDALGFPMAEVGLPAAELRRVLPDLAWTSAALHRAEDVARRRAGPQMFPVTGFLRQAVRFLGHGGVLVMPGDGRWGRRFHPVPFLGGIAHLPTGGARMAALAGAPVLLTHAIRTGPGRHQLRLGPVRFAPVEGQVHDRTWVEQTVRWYARHLEGTVREFPQQYLFRLAILHRQQERGLERFYEPVTPEAGS